KKEKEKSQKPEQATENAKPQDKIDENPVKQKAKDYGAWAKQQLQSSGKPHKTASRLDLIDTKAFDGLSRKELLEYYTPSKFYSLSGKQRDALCQATVNEYLISHGCRPCPVGFMDMPVNDRCVYYGLYRPQYQEIFINDNLFNNIDTLSDQNNTNFPYQILSTLIHEATHHMQFSDIERGADNEKTRLIKRSMMNNQNNMSFSEYLAEADELDARNSALEYIREASYEAGAGRQNLMAFYNVQKNSEIKSPKKEVSKQVHSFFPDIYDNTFLSPSIESTSRMAANAKEMNEIIKGHFIAEHLQRRKRF
ncbi:MAG: hypothetical protein IJS74_02250, partial [Clostridia bacterium]|nr:hypothetical protein [Clostridia bacterium]